MKKICTFLLFAGIFFSFKTNAQLTCNASFTKQFLSVNTVKFIPAVITDSPVVQHSWHFGDNTPNSNFISPAHYYASAGVYAVMHIISRVNPNGVSVCNDTVTQVVTIMQQCNLTPSFTSQTNPAQPLKVYFTNTSAGFAAGDSIRWSFGDGTFSYNVNPDHTYADTGNYNVCIRVKKNYTTPAYPPCIAELCNIVSVGILPNACNLRVNFTQQADSSHPNIIHFTSTTIGYAPGDSITWSFGDGTFSHDINPTHTYVNAGAYNVCLLIKKNTASGTNTCIREKCYNVSIVLPCVLTANFNWYRDSTALSIYSYHFNNTSAPISSIDSIRWTFGDGTSSNTASPNHTFTQPGTYNVCMRIIKRNSSGALTNCVADICKTVIVSQACNIIANYTWRADTANHKKIFFTNTTLSATANITTTWYFGDGSSATSYNAAHEYAQPGRYYVCLRIQYGTCVNYKCDSVTVTVPEPSCTQLSNYHFIRSSADNQQYSFTPNFTRPNTQYTWTFGDGTGSHDVTATHRFATAGTFTVCLTAFKNAGCASTTCNAITVQAQPNCNTATLGFNDHRDSLFPNRITFIANSNATITDQLWAITKIPVTAGTGTATIHQNNPTYIFADSGYYRVCLKAKFAGGCIKELCKTIHIASNIPATNTCILVAYPNPATASVHVNLSLSQPLLLTGYIYNSANILVAQKQQQGVIGANVFSINTANLSTGIYTIRVVYGNQVCYASFIKI